MANIISYTKARIDTLLQGKASLPTGGVNGQSLVKSGTDTTWGTGGLTAAQIAAAPTVRAALVPFWAPNETVSAGVVRMTATGRAVIRNASGTTSATYDATEAALWTIALPLSFSSLTVGLGTNAQLALTTGSNNNAVGTNAQLALTTGNDNNAVGTNAQRALTTGVNNNAVGTSAQLAPLGNSGFATTTAFGQTSIGHETGQNTATPVNDITVVGYRATAGATKGTAVGSQSRADHTGSVALGSDTQTTAAGQVMVGPRNVEITDATKGVVLRAPNGSRWRLTVSDTGVLTTIAA